MFEIDKIKQGISLQEADEIVDKALLILQLMYDSGLDDKTTELLMNELLPKFVEPAYLYDLQGASMRFLKKLGITIEDFYTNDGQPVSVAVLKEESAFRDFFNSLLKTIWAGLVIKKIENPGNTGGEHARHTFETTYSKLTNIARFLLVKNFLAFSLIHNGIMNGTLPQEDINAYYRHVNNTFRTFPQFIGYSDYVSAFLSTTYGGRMYNAFMSDLCNAYSCFYGSDTGRMLNFVHEFMTLLQQIQPLTILTNVQNNKYGLPILTIRATKRKRLELKPSILSKLALSDTLPQNLMRAIDDDWYMLNSDLVIAYKSATNNPREQAMLHQIAIKYIIKGRISLYEKMYQLVQKKYKTAEKYDIMLRLSLAINSLRNMSNNLLEPAVKYTKLSSDSHKGAKGSAKKVSIRTIH